MKSLIIFFTCLNLAQPIIANAIYYDWEWNSGGTIDCVPTYGAAWDEWGDWSVTTVRNDTPYEIHIVQFGFPCNYGDGTGPNQDVWCAIWYNIGGLYAPPGGPNSADVYVDFDPVDMGNTSPPTIYSYVDVETLPIVIDVNSYFYFGIKNPGQIGQIGFNGTFTWSWGGQSWSPDGKNGRTAVLQVRASELVGIESTSLGTIKAAFK